jgi:hypothetical protein
MTEPQGVKGDVKAGPKVCPSCHRENELALIACWKCGTVFEIEAGEKKVDPATSLLIPGSLVLTFALLVLALVLAKNLTPIISGGSNAKARTLAQEQQSLARKVSAGKIDPWKVQTASDLAKIFPEMGGPGAYRFLVTNLSQDLVSKESQTLYFDGLIGSYLRSHDGAKVMEKKESMVGGRYRAFEYKIGFQNPEAGRMQPFIHHAVATVIDGKAYTVSADYPQALTEDGSAMKEHLLNSIRAAQKPGTEPSAPSS